MKTDLLDLMNLDRCLTPAERKALLKRVPKRSKARPSDLPGPLAETCGTCANHVANDQWSKRYYKCKLVHWTHGPGTDIRLKDPACSLWRAIEQSDANKRKQENAS